MAAKKTTARKPAKKKAVAKKRTGKKRGPKTANSTSFKIGNTEWEKRNIHGRSSIYENPQELWDNCVRYFEWVEANPLKAVETVKYQGVGDTMEVNRVRAMTIKGMCVFLNIAETTWKNYKANADFLSICTQVESIIFTQKFEGAAAGLLEQNIIARELGLVDKQETSVRGDLTVAGDVLYRRRKKKEKA